MHQLARQTRLAELAELAEEQQALLRAWKPEHEFLLPQTVSCHQLPGLTGLAGLVGAAELQQQALLQAPKH